MQEKYKIPLKSLSEGEHLFEYELNSVFFSSYDVFLEDELSGDLHADVLVLKKNNEKKIEISLSGSIKTYCDRCLEALEIPFSEKSIFFVRDKEENDESKDGIIFVGENDVCVELSQLFYEIVVTGLPQRKIHQSEEDCNVEMLGHLRREEDDEEDIDPRWSELKKLMK